MTEPEIQAWLHRLASSDKARISRIRELLRCAVGDRMSEEDKVICRRCLVELEERVMGPDREGPS